MKEIVRKTAEVQFNGVTSEINSWKNMVSKLPPFLKDELVGYTLQILTVHFQENKMLGRYIYWELHRKFHTRKWVNYIRMQLCFIITLYALKCYQIEQQTDN